MSPSPRTVACPACGKNAPFDPSNRWRPFCSERCRLVDLGAWAEEAYRIPEERPAEERGADENDSQNP
jgi:endogenous inhibitor of DNA gyrase (YacG/DUF329 family)